MKHTSSLLKKCALLASCLLFMNSGSKAQSCDSLLIPAGTILLTNDTTFNCTGGPLNFLVCPGTTVNFTDNSCFHTFYLEPGSNLIFDTTFSYGYSTIYAQQGSTVDANFKQIMNLHFETGALLIDTATGPPSYSPMNLFPCSSMSFDYSLSGSCPSGVGISDETSRNTFSLFPNPVTNQIYVQSESVIRSLIIYDVSGNLVGEYAISNNVATLGNLDNGFYTVQLVGVNGNIEGCKQIVKIE